MNTEEAIPASTTQAKKLNLQKHLPPPPPRPHTEDFTHITVMLYNANNPILKLRGEGEIRIGRENEESKLRWTNLDLSAYDENKHSISRRHCRIYCEDGEYFIEDLKSRNGTWVNGRRIESLKPITLKNRDYIQVGKVAFWIFFPNPSENTPQNNS